VEKSWNAKVDGKVRENGKKSGETVISLLHMAQISNFNFNKKAVL